MWAKNTARPIPIPALTGLRFYAAFFVLLSHTEAAYTAPPLFPPHAAGDIWRIASLGMTLFFVLSGFVIQYNYGLSLSAFRLGAIWQFIVARISRLYPLLLLAALLWCAFKGIFYFDDENNIMIWSSFLTMTQGWFHVIVDDIPLGDIIVPTSWSVSAEFILYLIFIPVAPILNRINSRKIMGFLFLALVAAMISFTAWIIIYGMPGEAQWDWYDSPISRLPEFALGATVCRYIQVQGDRLRRVDRVMSACAMIFAFAWAAFVFGLYYFVNLQPCFWLVLSIVYAPAAAAAIYYFAAEPRETFLVTNPAIILLGEASYSLYIFHTLVLAIFPRPTTPDLFVIAAKIAGVWAICALLSLGCWRYFEMPARRFVRNLLTGRSRERGQFAGDVVQVHSPPVKHSAHSR